MSMGNVGQVVKELPERSQSLQEFLGEFKKFLRSCQCIMANMSLALAMSDKPDDFSGHVLNELISKAVGRTGPRILHSEGDLGLSTPSPDWNVAITVMEAGSVKRGEDGLYCCEIQGRLVGWDETENAFLRHFASARFPRDEDVQREKKARSEVLAPINTLRGVLAETLENVTKFYQDMMAVDPRSVNWIESEVAAEHHQQREDEPADTSTDMRSPQSLASNSSEVNSILNDASGDINFHSNETHLSDDRREVDCATAALLMTHKIHESNMAQAVGPMPESVPHGDQDLSRPSRSTRRQLGTPTSATRTRRNYEQIKQERDFIDAKQKEGLGWDKIRALYNDKFRKNRSVRQIKRDYKAAPKEKRPKNKKLHLDEPGQAEPLEGTSQASIAFKSSSDVTAVAPAILNGFVPLVPRPSGAEGDVQYSGL